MNMIEYRRAAAEKAAAEEAAKEPMTARQEGVKHTPTPWKSWKARGGRLVYGGETVNEAYLDSDGDGVDVFRCVENGGPLPISAQEAEANAAHIVQCVNAHSQLTAEVVRLREALTETREYFDQRADIDGQSNEDGSPRPNKEMRLLAVCDTALGGGA